jgi:chemotaxis protein CheD
MAEPDQLVEVVLGPGDLYFGDRRTRIRTLLGSCVAVTLWHPKAQIGGMCHYMMPTRRGEALDGELSGRYADEAMEILMEELQRAGTSPRDYQVKMFGGGNQFAGASGIDVAARNVDFGMVMLARHDLSLSAMHLGGNGHRQVILELWSGDVWLRHVDHLEAVSAR